MAEMAQSAEAERTACVARPEVDHQKEDDSDDPFSLAALLGTSIGLVDEEWQPLVAILERAKQRRRDERLRKGDLDPADRTRWDEGMERLAGDVLAEMAATLGEEQARHIVEVAWLEAERTGVLGPIPENSDEAEPRAATRREIAAAASLRLLPLVPNGREARATRVLRGDGVLRDPLRTVAEDGFEPWGEGGHPGTQTHRPAPANAHAG